MAWENLPSTNTPLEATNLLNNVYPVGSIYMSVNNTSPATLFGGTWEQIKDKFLLSAGDNYVAGDTGGEATHILTENEIPSHSHGLPNGRSVTQNNDGYFGSLFSTDGSGDRPFYVATNNTGGGQAHNNMPPYLVIYMWKRVQ